MIGNAILQFKRLDSTNNYVAKAIKRDEYDFGTVILAHSQTHGRGQRQAKWQSEPGLNLTFSFGLPLSGFDPGRYYLLSKALSLGMVNTLQPLLPNTVTVKWPNDILVGNRKIAGMLIETVLAEERVAVCGIGLNVNQTDFPRLPQATSMALEAERKFNQSELLENLLSRMRREWVLLYEGDFRDLDTRFEAILHGMGREVTAIVKGGRMPARIMSVEPDGRLALRLNGSVQSFTPKQVRIEY